MPRFRDNQGWFKRTPQPSQTNPSPSGADVVKHLTPAEENLIQALEDKQKSGQRLTLVERQTLYIHKSQKRDFPRSATQGESSAVIQYTPEIEHSPETEHSYLNRLFEGSDSDTEKSTKMAEEGDG